MNRAAGELTFRSDMKERVFADEVTEKTLLLMKAVGGNPTVRVMIEVYSD